MASYSDKTYTFDGLKVQYGLGLAFNMAGKYPAITKRIFDTKAMAQAFIDDKDDSAVVGLTLTVIADTTENNGVYFVKSIGDGINSGVLEKLGSSQGTSDVKEALEKLQNTVGASEVSGLTEALKDTAYLSGTTTDSVVDALVALDTILNNIQGELTKTQITSVTFNDVTGTVTSSETGTAIALTADTSDIKVADDFTATVYPTALSGASAIETGDTVSSAFNKVEKTVSALTEEVLANERTTAAAIKALGEAADIIDEDNTIAYKANTATTYISGATTLKDADEKLDAAIKALDSKLTIGSTDKTVTVTTSATATDLKVNIDGKTLSADTDGVISTQLTIAKLTDAEINALTDADKANIKEAYKLVDAENSQKGNLVKIYKDSSLKSVDFVEEKPAETEGGEATKGQFLKLVYIKADGSEETVYVDMSALISDKEFGSGVTVTTAGIVTGVVDTTSETFLTVGANGFKLSGVQTAIDKAAASAKTVVDHATANKNITVTSATDATDGHVTYTVNETGLTPTEDKNYIKASNTVTANLEALDTQVKENADGISENAITSVTFNDVTGTVTSTTDGTSISLSVDGDDIKVGDYTSVTYADPFSAKTGVSSVVTGDTLDAAINKVESAVKVLVDEVLANERTTAAAVKALGNAAGIIDENDEIIYQANTAATYIKTATSLKDADDKLDAAINSTKITGGTITGTHIASSSTVNVNNNTVTITANVDLPDPVAYTGENAIEITGTDTSKTVKLVLDSAAATDGSAKIDLTQSTDGLKAEVKLDNTASQAPTTEGATAEGGIGLAQGTDGTVKATMYWGTF